jgi:hypothetical protein
MFVLYCLGSWFHNGLRSGLEELSGWCFLQDVFWTIRKFLWQPLQRHRRCFTTLKFSVLKFTWNDTWYFYFNAITSIHSILGTATDNCKSLLKFYFNWLYQRCHVNPKKWKGCLLIQNSRPFRRVWQVYRREETKRECEAEKKARTFKVYELIHKNRVQNMNKVDTGEDTILLIWARLLVKHTGFLKILVFHLCLTITKIS